MNFQANKIKMQNSFYDSPHGLMNKNNFSTAADQAILVSECMKLDIFRRVVGTKEYSTSALSGSPVGGGGFTNSYKWENSNKLLGKTPGILGCKTGITSAAGPCFAGYYERAQRYKNSNNFVPFKISRVSVCRAEMDRNLSFGLMGIKN